MDTEELIGMTTSFDFNTSFTSVVHPASGQFFPSGFTNPMMKGSDGNHYILSADGVGSEVLCAETGSRTVITTGQLQSDMTALGIANSVGYISIPVLWSAPDTPYFYLVVAANDSPEHDIALVLYKIVSDGVLTAVGAINYKTHGGNIGLVSSAQAAYSFKVIDGFLHVVHTTGFVRHVSHWTVPLDETVTIDFSAGAGDAYFTTTPFNDEFFDFIPLARSGQAGTTIVNLGPGQIGFLTYIGQAEYDYIAARPGHCAQWDAITGPCVLWCLATAGGLTDVTTEFGITDIKTHLDGSASTSGYDDYVSPCSFNYASGSYVIFIRSYTRPSDLEPVGTLVRVRIYTWDGSTATSAFDHTTAIFDPVADCGVAESSRTDSYPGFVHGCFDPTDHLIRFVWYGAAGSLTFAYVFGGLIQASTTDLEQFVTFSEFVNPSFTDWQTADPSGLGADVTSSLTTYYILEDDTILWMYAPYIYCYVENTERSDVGLMMQPQWDWSEDATTKKFARSVEVYREADLRLVSVTKNRVRGKGRALQLHFISEPGKDFNLLGWGIDFNKNARF